MKAKLLLCLALLATLGMTGCKKDKDEPKEPTSVKIGNKDYAIVKIGTQTWTAENYNGEGGITYNNDNSKPEYGKYYTFEQASSIPVPQGWRLPTKDDVKKLLEAQGITVEVNTMGFVTYNADAIKKLMSKTGWANNIGTNASGFNALPVGWSPGGTSVFVGHEENTLFWISSRYNPSTDNYPMFFSISHDEEETRAFCGVSELSDYERLSVRFVKDN